MGVATPRIEGRAKVTGAAIYAAETLAGEMLHAVLVESPIARGRVTAIDASAARLTPGFADVVSWEDAQGLKASSSLALVREPLIHFAGQPVALVVANSEIGRAHV